MDEITSIILVILILCIILVLIAPRFRHVDAEVESYLGKARFSGQKDESIAFGKSEVSNILGKNIEMGDVTGIKGDSKAIGEVYIQDIQAQENIKIGNVTGNKNTESSE